MALHILVFRGDGDGLIGEVVDALLDLVNPLHGLRVIDLQSGSLLIR